MAAYNRVYIAGLPIRKLDSGKKDVDVWGAAADLVPFLVEELVARSAVSVAVSGNAIKGIDLLDPLLKKRVEVIDDQEPARQAFVLTAPLLEELGIDVELENGLPMCYSHGKGDFPEEIEEAIFRLVGELPTFLQGMKHGLQIDIGVQKLAVSLTILRRCMRNPEGRAILASLQGVIGTYKRVDVPGMAFTSRAGGELAELFAQLVEDQTYKEASSHAHSLGIPGRMKRGLALLRRRVTALLSRKDLKRVFRMGTRTVEAVTSLPTPDSDLMADLLKRGFLPPVVDLRGAMQDARKAWQRANPDEEWIDPRRRP